MDLDKLLKRKSTLRPAHYLPNLTEFRDQGKCLTAMEIDRKLRGGEIFLVSYTINDIEESPCL